jgi:hypothetical protein
VCYTLLHLSAFAFCEANFQFDAQQMLTHFPTMH